MILLLLYSRHDDSILTDVTDDTSLEFLQELRMVFPNKSGCYQKESREN